MTKFINGPAHDVTLSLARAAVFLRVVDNGKEFDALDLPTDRAEPNEKIYAYYCTAHHGTMHINRGRKGSGFFPMVEYTFVPEQPSDDILRDNAKWAAWCQENAQKYIRIL